MICKNQNKICYIKAARSVFFKNNGYIKPTTSFKEYHREQELEATDQLNERHEVFHGFNITNDQSICVEQLGVREDLVATMNRKVPGRNHLGQIIDENINGTLRDRIVEREENLERQQMNWWRRGVARMAGTFWNIWGTVRHFDPHYNLTRRQERSYGAAESVDQKRVFLAQQTWNALAPWQRAQVQAELIREGVPLPPPGPVNPQIQQLANANVDALIAMRITLSTPPNAIFPRIDDNNHPLYPITRPRGYDTRKPYARAAVAYNQDMPNIDRLIELRNVEGIKRKKRLSTTVYDYRRLQNWYDNLQTGNPALFTDIQNILVEHWGDELKGNAEALSLLAYLEERLQRMGPAQVQTELAAIRQQLPEEQETPHPGHAPSENVQRRTRINELRKIVSENYTNLKKCYTQAPTLADAIYNATDAFNRMPAPVGGGGGGSDGGRTAAKQNVDRLGDKKIELQTKINETEGIYMDASRELSNLLNTIDPIPAVPAGTTGAVAGNARGNIMWFSNNVGGFPATVSTEEQIFGTVTPPLVAPGTGGTPPARTPATNNNLINHIQTGFTTANLAALEGEINNHYFPRLQTRKRITPAQLQFMLTQNDVTRAGITTPGMAMAIAIAKTNLNIAHASPKNVQFRRSVNLELAERLGEETLGSRHFNRFKKWMQAKTNTGGVIELKDIIAYLFSDLMDPDLKIFKEIRPNSTPAEIRDLINLHNCKDPKVLLKAAAALKEVVNVFEPHANKKYGEAKILESNITQLEDLHDAFEETAEQMNAEEVFAKMPGMHHKIPDVLEEVKKYRELRNKDDETLASVSEAKNFMKRKFLKEKVLQPVLKARQNAKEQGLSRAQRNEMLQAENLETANDIFAGAIAAKGVYDASEKGLVWTGGKLKDGTMALGRGAVGLVKGVGKYGVYMPLKYGVYWPARLAFWETPKLIGRGIAAPFKLAGRLLKGSWNMAKGKGGGGHGGGHGGGGHH